MTRIDDLKSMNKLYFVPDPHYIANTRHRRLLSIYKCHQYIANIHDLCSPYSSQSVCAQHYMWYRVNILYSLIYKNLQDRFHKHDSNLEYML